MNVSTTKTMSKFTSYAGLRLAALDMKLQYLDLFGPIHRSVCIAQKAVKRTLLARL